eukprot:TRINITY_DN2989_c0_g1_i1.p1 TRINITY_DN2989_c0_g1~~TRINITY_DN2989_c0_g1_i1.p1  ORF type:complete len:404 (-),score=21.14 TRINITY_DN2989_c0_g1_i1:192-1403(-)
MVVHTLFIYSVLLFRLLFLQTCNPLTRNSELFIISIIPLWIVTAYLNLYFFKQSVVFYLIQMCYAVWIIWQLKLLTFEQIGTSSGTLANANFRYVKVGVVQYVLIVPTVAVVTLMLAFSGSYSPAAPSVSYFIGQMVSIVSLVVCVVSFWYGHRMVYTPIFVEQRVKLKLWSVLGLCLLKLAQDTFIASLWHSGVFVQEDVVFPNSVCTVGWANVLLIFELPLFQVGFWFAFGVSPSEYMGISQDVELQETSSPSTKFHGILLFSEHDMVGTVRSPSKPRRTANRRASRKGSNGKTHTKRARSKQLVPAIKKTPKPSAFLPLDLDLQTNGHPTTTPITSTHNRTPLPNEDQELDSATSIAQQSALIHNFEDTDTEREDTEEHKEPPRLAKSECDHEEELTETL